jgi:hypothetical protein
MLLRLMVLRTTSQHSANTTTDFTQAQCLQKYRLKDLGRDAPTSQRKRIIAMTASKRNRRPSKRSGVGL